MGGGWNAGKVRKKKSRKMANKRKTLTKLDSANKNNRFGCSMRHFSVCHRRQRTKFFFQPVVWRLTAYKIEWITHKEYTHFPIASLFLCVYFFIFEGPFYVLFIRSAYIWCEWNTKTNNIYTRIPINFFAQIILI